MVVLAIIIYSKASKDFLIHVSKSVLANHRLPNQLGFVVQVNYT